MTDKDSLPAIHETRSDRVLKVVQSLSECEQEQVRWALNTMRLQRLNKRLADWKTAFLVGMQPGIVFGLIFGLFEGLRCSLPQLSYGVGVFLFSFIVLFVGICVSCSIGMAVALAFVYKLLYPRILANLVAGKTSTFRAQKFEMPLPADECLKVCKTAFEARKGTRLEHLDEKHHELRATTRMSWSSPGESIGVKLDPVDANTTVATVYSKELFNSWGLGKNARNVKELKASIEESAHVHKILLEHGHGT